MIPERKAIVIGGGGIAGLVAASLHLQFLLTSSVCNKEIMNGAELQFHYSSKVVAKRYLSKMEMSVRSSLLLY